MRNDRLASGHFDDARIIGEEARESLAKGHYHRTVRKCQEATEMALKGLLRMVGIEYPKSHMIGSVLLSPALEGKVEAGVLKKLAAISDQLALDRETAFYGSEEESAQELFEQNDAEEALENCNFVLKEVERIITGS